MGKGTSMRLWSKVAAGIGGAGAFGLAIQACAQGGPATGNAQRGGQLFASQCALCHSNAASMDAGAGPPLWGVAGRKAASAPNFGYSAALKGTGWTWDDARLDKFLTNPAEAVPGTTMPVAIGVPADRRDLIAYLHTLRDTGSTAAPLSTAPAGGSGRAKSDGSGTLGASKPSGSAASVFADWRADAPGRRHRITVADLPAPFATRSAGNPSQRIPRAPGALPQAPAGMKVAVFAEGLKNPRRMTVAPNGDVFLAETGAGRVRVLRPSPDGAKPASSEPFAEGLDGPFGMAFYPSGPNPEWVYVAEENRVVRFPYRGGDLRARGKAEVIVPRLAPTGGGHTMRDLAFSADGKRLLISVGSQSNVAQQIGVKSAAEATAFDRARGAVRASWDAEENRAAVLVTSPTGGPVKLFATGIRNCVGLTVQPANGAVWCAVNERDGLGDDLVPDYVTRVKEGAYYGWPWFYLGDHEEPRLKGARPDLRGKATVPDVLIQPHSAPMQIVFYQGAMFPAWRGSGLVALHGSWNRAKRTGYKLVRVLTDRAGAPTGEYEDVLTGFVASDEGVWGRPVGVATAKDGSILVSDDGGGVIWRLSKG